MTSDIRQLTAATAEAQLPSPKHETTFVDLSHGALYMYISHSMFVSSTWTCQGDLDPMTSLWPSGGVRPWQSCRHIWITSRRLPVTNSTEKLQGCHCDRIWSSVYRTRTKGKQEAQMSHREIARRYVSMRNVTVHKSQKCCLFELYISTHYIYFMYRTWV